MELFVGEEEKGVSTNRRGGECMLCNSKGREHVAKWCESTKVETCEDALLCRCFPLLLVFGSRLTLWLQEGPR